MIGIDTFGLRKKCVQIRYPFIYLTCLRQRRHYADRSDYLHYSIDSKVAVRIAYIPKAFFLKKILPKMIGMDTLEIWKKRVCIRYPLRLGVFSQCTW